MSASKSALPKTPRKRQCNLSLEKVKSVVSSDLLRLSHVVLDALNPFFLIVIPLVYLQVGHSGHASQLFTFHLWPCLGSLLEFAQNFSELQARISGAFDLGIFQFPCDALLSPLFLHAVVTPRKRTRHLISLSNKIKSGPRIRSCLAGCTCSQKLN